MVTSSMDSSVILWDLKSGSEFYRWRTMHPALDVAISERGIVVSGCEDGEIRLFDINKLEQIGTLTGHRGAVSAILTTSRERVISGSHDRTLRIWDLATKECEKVLTGHKNPIADIALAGPNRLASLDTSELKVWDLELGEMIHSITGGYGAFDPGACTKFAVTPDGNTAIVSLGHDGVATADLESGTIPDGLHAGPQWINSFAMFRDGQRAVVGFSSMSNSFGILSWHDGFEVREISESHSQTLTALALTPDETHILTGSSDCTIKLWRTEYLAAGRSNAAAEDQPYLAETARHFLAVNGIVQVGDTEYFLSGGQDYYAKLWSARTGELVRDLNVDSMFRAPFGGTTAVLATPDGRLLIAGSARGRVRAWHTDSGKEAFDWSSGSDIRQLVTCSLGEWLVGGFEARFEDGACFYVRNLKGYEDGTAYSLDRYQHSEFGLMKREVQALAWIPQLKGVAFITDRGEVGIGKISAQSHFFLTDKRVGANGRSTAKVVGVADDRVFLLVDRNEIWLISFVEDQPFDRRLCRIPNIFSAAYDAVRSRCLVGTFDGEILSVDTDSGQVSPPIAAHGGAVNDIVVGPGCIAITCSQDQTVKCWDARTWVETTHFQGESGILRAAYSRQWSVVAVGEASGRVHILHFDQSDNLN